MRAANVDRLNSLGVPLDVARRDSVVVSSRRSHPVDLSLFRWPRAAPCGPRWCDRAGCGDEAPCASASRPGSETRRAVRCWWGWRGTRNIRAPRRAATYPDQPQASVVVDKLVAKRGEPRTHSTHGRVPAEQETARPRLPADVREAEEVERVWLALSPIPTLLRRELAEARLSSRGGLRSTARRAGAASQGRVHEVGCWSHGRIKFLRFVQRLPSSSPGRARGSSRGA